MSSLSQPFGRGVHATTFSTIRMRCTCRLFLNHLNKAYMPLFFLNKEVLFNNICVKPLIYLLMWLQHLKKGIIYKPFESLQAIKKVSHAEGKIPTLRRYVLLSLVSL